MVSLPNLPIPFTPKPSLKPNYMVCPLLRPIAPQWAPQLLPWSGWWERPPTAFASPPHPGRGRSDWISGISSGNKNKSKALGRNLIITTPKKKSKIKADPGSLTTWSAWRKGPCLRIGTHLLVTPTRRLNRTVFWKHLKVRIETN